jgi:hypothetical protein
VIESAVPQQASGQSEAPEHPNPARLKLEVVVGAHRGAVLLLDGSDYRIGSSPAADIVLSDAGVAAQHAALHVERGAVRLDAIGADVTVGEELVPVSRGCRVSLPVSFSLGAAQIYLSDPAVPPQGASGQSLRRPLIVVGALAFAGLAIAMAAREFPQTAVSRMRTAEFSDGGAAGDRVSRPQSDPSKPAGSSTADARSLPGSAMQDAMSALRTRLETAKIETLQISDDGGRIVASGTLSSQAAAEWAAIEQWFDSTYGGSIILASKVAPASGPRTMPSLQIQAVWYGEQPYIVTADGEHYFKGAVLDNGWIIRDIGENRLLLAKDMEIVALTYR